MPQLQIRLRRLSPSFAGLSVVGLSNNPKEWDQIFHSEPVVLLKRHAPTSADEHSARPAKRFKPAKTCFAPQVGDLAVYLRDAHASWLADNGLADVSQPPARQPVRVVGIRYCYSRNKRRRGSAWLLRLRLQPLLTGCGGESTRAFEIAWPVLSPRLAPEFLVPLSDYNKAMQRHCWNVGDRLLCENSHCCHDNARRTPCRGTVKGFVKSRLVSGWRCIRVSWDSESSNNGCDNFVSPWHMRPLTKICSSAFADQPTSTCSSTIRKSTQGSNNQSESLRNTLNCLEEFGRNRWRYLFPVAFLSDCRTRRRRPLTGRLSRCAPQFFPISFSSIVKRLRLGQYRHLLSVLCDMAVLLTNYRCRLRLAYRLGDSQETIEAALNVQRASLLCDTVAACCRIYVKDGRLPNPRTALYRLLMAPGRECLLAMVPGALR